MVVDRGQQEHPDAGAAARPVDEPDPEGLGRPARRDRAMGMPVAVVDVAVGMQELVRVEVDVEEPAPPPDEEPDGEARDQHSDRRIGALLHSLG